VKLPAPEHLVKEAPSSSDPTPPQLQPYLLGTWRDVWVAGPQRVHAHVGCGTQPVSLLLAKSAARRVLLLGLRARNSGFSMVHGHQPRLWPAPDGSGGLPALEHTQVAGPVVAPVRPVA
jgi:hypothetical protein